MLHPRRRIIVNETLKATDVDCSSAHMDMHCPSSRVEILLLFLRSQLSCYRCKSTWNSLGDQWHMQRRDLKCRALHGVPSQSCRHHSRAALSFLWLRCGCTNASTQNSETSGLAKVSATNVLRPSELAQFDEGHTVISPQEARVVLVWGSAACKSIARIAN